MDYLTLKKHCAELASDLSDKPLIARILAIPGRGFSFRLKAASGFIDLVFQLDPALQGCWLTAMATEVEKSSGLIRQMQRLLTNGRIIALGLAGSEEKMQFDRVVKIHIAVADNFFGNRSDYFLICEFTGRIADIFLCDADLQIIDRFGKTTNNKIGETYQLPASECSINPFVADIQQLDQAFSNSPSDWSHLIGGFSPQLAKELARRTNNDRTSQALAKELKSIVSENESGNEAFLVMKEGKVQGLFTYKPSIEAKSFASVGKALAFADSQAVAVKRFSQAKEQILNHFRKELKKRNQILQKQQRLKQDFANAQELQKIGNLLTANLYRIPAAAKKIELEDWETGEKLEIALDPSKPASVQAQKYFQRYRKAQRGTVEVARRIEELEADIRWLNEQLWLTENAESEADLPEVDKKQTRKEKKEKKVAGNRRKIHFPHFLEINDCRFYVGKNGRQNDLVTFQVASRKDRWFHANDVPGAHVVLKKITGEIEEVDLYRGALLAAWFSFARESSKVAVDTTEVAWVKKIPGGGPGRVSYTRQNTIFVDPQEAKELVDKANTGEKTC